MERKEKKKCHVNIAVDVKKKNFIFISSLYHTAKANKNSHKVQKRTTLTSNFEISTNCRRKLKQ